MAQRPEASRRVRDESAVSAPGNAPRTRKARTCPPETGAVVQARAASGTAGLVAVQSARRGRLVVLACALQLPVESGGVLSSAEPLPGRRRTQPDVPQRLPVP